MTVLIDKPIRWGAQYPLAAPNGDRWRDILRRDPCAYCCGPSDTVDHICPIAAGAPENGGDNLTGACFACNQVKAHTPLLLFLRRIRWVVA